MLIYILAVLRFSIHFRINPIRVARTFGYKNWTGMSLAETLDNMWERTYCFPEL